MNKRCTGKSATGKSETVAVLSGRTFAGQLMVALLPIDIGKSATLIISIKKIWKVLEKPKNYFSLLPVALLPVHHLGIFLMK